MRTTTSTKKTAAATTKRARKPARKPKTVTIEQALENSRKALLPALGAICDRAIGLWSAIDGGASAEKVSEKALRASNLIRELDICDPSKRSIASLVSLMLDEEVPFMNGQGFLRRGMIVVPISEHRNHDYLNKVTLIGAVDDDGDATGIVTGGESGNTLYADIPKASVRNATKAEALDLLATLSPDMLKAIVVNDFDRVMNLADD